ncbi:MAG: hypothetical protein L0I62_02145 [Gammaproteobacteria bacterium]|nr:hypothetical protein [Gammaproteobacteria bacterium]
MIRICTVAAFVALLGLGASPGARADSWVEFGVGAWHTALSGKVSFPRSGVPNPQISLDGDLGMSSNWNPMYHFEWHHAIPILPDVRLEYGTLLADGSNAAHREFCYGGILYVADGRLVSQTALKLARVLFYWNPVDNSVLDLRLGLDFRWVNLDMSATGTAEVSAGDPFSCAASPRQRPRTSAAPKQTLREQRSVSAGVVTWLPQANLGLTVHLPANFDIFFDASGVPYASSYLYDLRAGVQYRFDFGLVLTAGYRRWRLHLDNSDWSVNGDVDFRGPYATLSWNF